MTIQVKVAISLPLKHHERGIIDLVQLQHIRYWQ